MYIQEHTNAKKRVVGIQRVIGLKTLIMVFTPKMILIVQFVERNAVQTLVVELMSVEGLTIFVLGGLLVNVVDQEHQVSSSTTRRLQYCLV